MIIFALVTLFDASKTITILGLFNDLFNAILQVLDLIFGIRLN